MNDFRVESQLLFGLLAVRSNLIAVETLLEAADRLARDEVESIDRALLDLKALHSEDHALLHGLMMRLLARHGDDARAALTDLSRADIPVTDLIQRFDTRYRQLADPTLDTVPARFENAPRPSDQPNQATSETFAVESKSDGSTLDHPRLSPGEDTVGWAGTSAQMATMPASAPATPPTSKSGSASSLPPARPATGSGSPPPLAWSPGLTSTPTPYGRQGHGQERQGNWVGPSSSSGRFRALYRLAEGGLGKVSVAMDRELNREVAFKEMKPHLSQNEESRSRFLLEARVTGKLEHPGIVPVYGLGVHDDGRPYYAMRMIKGQSLKEALEVYHNRKPLWTPGQANLQLRPLLRRFLDVCDAIGYAHSRGVLHRDIKPSNIMLGKYGETLVVDWGLAKLLDRPRGKLSVVVRETALVDALNSVERADTRTGAVVGSPPYMSPEQACGQHDQLGPESDVYSLGATLYHLIVGRAPFEGHDLAVLLNRVRAGDFPAPRKVDPRIDPELDALCLKAMALNPRNRYASPSDLAEDVEAWVSRRPVAALNQVGPICRVQAAWKRWRRWTSQ